MEVKIVQGGLFEVAVDGTVYRLSNGYRRLAQQSYTSRNRKYAVVTAYEDGKQKHFYVHRLVAEAFIPNPKNKPQVNHIDGKTRNNHMSNLEWVTARENVRHAYKTGLHTVSICEKCGRTFISKHSVCFKCLYECEASLKKEIRKEAFIKRKIIATENTIQDINFNSLNNRQVEVINYMLQGLSINEISRLIGVTKQAVFASYQSAKRHQI
ncbi:MAG: hypothetical protein K0R34_4094 [Herbinix sp.]|jgi:ribosomal protein L32|nr:hypothetical protein [Herbinix sp.]